jgi:hypothetical protein
VPSTRSSSVPSTGALDQLVFLRVGFGAMAILGGSQVSGRSPARSDTVRSSAVIRGSAIRRSGADQYLRSTTKGLEAGPALPRTTSEHRGEDIWS